MASKTELFRCGSCDRAYRWQRDHAGRRAKCACGAEMIVPDAPEGEQTFGGGLGEAEFMSAVGSLESWSSHGRVAQVSPAELKAIQRAEATEQRRIKAAMKESVRATARERKREKKRAAAAAQTKRVSDGMKVRPQSRHGWGFRIGLVFNTIMGPAWLVVGLLSLTDPQWAHRAWIWMILGVAQTLIALAQWRVKLFGQE